MVAGCCLRTRADHDIAPTTHTMPLDSTIKAINRALDNLDPRQRYTWHTVGDERVRDDHADRQGETFRWGQPPEGGHPGEDYNCRCWAVPIAAKVRRRPKFKCHTAGNWFAVSAQSLKEFEGVFDYPYLDTEGIITVGVGFNYDKLDDFLTIPFLMVDPETGVLRKTLPSEKEKQYYDLRSQATYSGNLSENGQFNVQARAQEDFTMLYVDDEWIEQKLKEAMNRFLSELHVKFTREQFECYPPTARIALMDMIYNLGGTKFSPDKWPRLFRAIISRNWAKAAEESNRKGISYDRNADIKMLFYRAESIEQAGIRGA